MSAKDIKSLDSRSKHSNMLPFTLIITSDPDTDVMRSFIEHLSVFASNHHIRISLHLIDSLNLFDSQPQNLKSKLKGVDFFWHKPPRNLSQVEAMDFGIQTSMIHPVLFMAPDMKDNIVDIPSFFQKAENGSEIVAAWRVSRHGVSVSRRALTIAFNFVVRHLAGVPLHDFNTCMSLLSKNAVTSWLNAPQGCPSVSLYVLSKHKDRTAEVPITIYEIPGKASTFTPQLRFRTGLRRIKEVICFRVWHSSKRHGGNA